MNNPEHQFYAAFWISFYASFLVAFVIVALLTTASSIKRKKNKLDQYKLTFLQIKLPADNEIEIKAAEHMFSNLVSFKKSWFKALFSEQYRISFEIVSKKEGISFFIVVPDGSGAILVQCQIFVNT